MVRSQDGNRIKFCPPDSGIKENIQQLFTSIKNGERKCFLEFGLQC